MGFSMKRISALLTKEVKGFIKNKNVLLMFLLPVLFAVIYSNLLGSDLNSGMDKVDILLLCISMNLIMSSSFVVAMLISEEKEKNTLRTLLLSGVSPLEFLSGKVLISLILSALSNVAVFLIVGISNQYMVLFLLLTTLVVAAMIGIGAIIGLCSPNQMATGTIGMPVIMIFLLLPMFASVNKTVETIAGYFPTQNLNIMLGSLLRGGGLGSESGMNMTIVVVWIVLSALAFAFTYNKVGLDR